MNSFIEASNLWGERFLSFAGPMLWQSSLLILVVFAVDFALRKKLRASVRYALWLVVLVKLLLPPALALPTSLAWWVRPAPVVPAKPPVTRVVVTYADVMPASLPVMPVIPTMEGTQATEMAMRPSLLPGGGLLLAWGIGAMGLLAWMFARWWQVCRLVKHAILAPELIINTAAEATRLLGMRRKINVRVTDHRMSPAVCELFRATILLPRSLVERFSPEQLRAVLLHELIHLRRGDVWLNCAQALLQIVYWWHPLLWFANARIRRVREEAVDDAVMLALRADAETYAPTLLEVAKLAFNRPLASLGLVGILESKSALRQRVERLVHFKTPRKTGLTFLSVTGIAVFASIAGPMGGPPPKPVEIADASNVLSQTKPVSDPNISTTTNKSSLTSRQKIMRKLDSIRFDTVEYKAIPLIDVLGSLSNQTQQLDPEKTGIHFRINPSADADLVKAEAVAINLKSPIHNLRLADVLDAIVQVADHPIKYSVSDYAVNFSLRGPEVPPLYIRTFKLDPDRVPELAKWLPRDDMDAKVAELKKKLADAGIDLGTPAATAQGKTMFYSDGHGELLVRATSQELDTIERTLKELSTVERASIKESAVTSGSQDANSNKRQPGSVRATTVPVEKLNEYNLLNRQITGLKQREHDDVFKLAYTDQHPHLIAVRSDIKRAEDKKSVLEKEYPTLVSRIPEGSKTFTGTGKQKIFSKLQGIRLDKIEFQAKPLDEVIVSLQNQVKNADPEKVGLNFVFNPTPATPDQKDTDIKAVTITIEPPLSDVRVVDALEAIVKTADKPITYRVRDYAIEIGWTTPEDRLRETRAFKVDPNTFQQGLEGVTPTRLPPSSDKEVDSNNNAASSLAQTNSGTEPQAGEAEKLMTRAYRLNPNGFYESLEKLTKTSLPRVDADGARTGNNEHGKNYQVWNGKKPVKLIVQTNDMEAVSIAARKWLAMEGVDFDSPQALAQGKSIFWNERGGELLVRATSKDLDAVEGALLKISAFWPARENAQILYDRTFTVDTNSFYKSLEKETKMSLQTDNMEAVSAAVRKWMGTIGVDMDSPQAIAQGKSIFWKESTGMLLVRATAQDLERIEFKMPAKVSLPYDQSRLLIRTFKVDPNSFYRGLEAESGEVLTKPNVKNPDGQMEVDPAKITEAVKAYFTRLGLDWNPALNKSVYWNDRAGELLVRATDQDLEMIQAAMQLLNRAPQQVNIKAKFVEISQDDNKAISPDINYMTFGGINWSTNGNSTYGILTDPQMKVIARGLEKRADVDILSMPEVTTVSGRQAQIQMVEIKNIVTATNSGLQTTPMSFGPTLDVIPHVMADGFFVQLKIIATVKEFMGYDDPGQFTPSHVETNAPSAQPPRLLSPRALGENPPQGKSSENEKVVKSVVPLPRYRTRQVTTTALVRDGQTVILGGPVSEETFRVKDKVPVLGDIPIVGKLFRSESTGITKKNLLVFVTPTLLDPAGNRLHAN